MTTFKLQEKIRATPAMVFNFMVDPANAGKVIDSVQKMEILTDGPMAAGTRMRETRLMNGKLAETELFVEEFQPPDRYVVSTEQSGITVTYTYSLQLENGGTAINLVAEIKGSGLKRLMLPVVAAVMKREDGDHLRHLKAAIEAAS